VTVEIFFCYAHEDEPFLSKLKSHLIPLKRQELIDFWYDREISAGAEWENEINQHLNSAQIILLLVSPDFIASDYINNVELKQAIERHKSGEARVIPIILRPVYWEGEPLGKLQALPRDAIPVSDPSWHDMDTAFLDVVKGIRKVIDDLQKRKRNNLPDSVVSAGQTQFPNDKQKLVQSVPQSKTEEIVKALFTLSGHTDIVLSIAISPNGQSLVSGSNDEKIKLWYLPDRQVLHTFEGLSGIVESVAISPDGEILASGSFDGSIKLWNLHSKELLYVLAPQNPSEKLFNILAGHSVKVLSIAISPDGQMLASSDTDSTIKLWNLQTRQQAGTLKGHSSIVYSVAISPDGQILASGSEDKTIILWNIANRQRLHELVGHTEPVVSVAVSPNGQLLATGSTDKTIKLWNLRTGERYCTLENSVPVWSVAFSLDGQILASGGSDGTIKVWKYIPG
jgi:WD40 repeat protein